jgi:hypothetical protein
MCRYTEWLARAGARFPSFLTLAPIVPEAAQSQTEHIHRLKPRFQDSEGSIVEACRYG